MKKQTLFLALLLLGIGKMSAQLEVSGIGNVGIQTGNNTAPLSSLSIGGKGSAASRVYVNAENFTNGIRVARSGELDYHHQYGITSRSYLYQRNKTYGIGGYAYAESPIGSGRAWGVIGYAGNSTSGYNYGVMGIHSGSEDGAGIVGTVNGNQDVCVPGIYAGYFVGDIRVTGQINGTLIGNSDIRYKQNIVELGRSEGINNLHKADREYTLNSVLEMTPVQYNLKQQYITTENDTTQTPQKLLDEHSQLFSKKHYGLIAQELQKIYPDLVYEDNRGYLGINYIGLIPVLIQSIKELNAKVEALEGRAPGFPRTKAAAKADNAEEPDGSSELREAALYQNTPNPFSQATEIRYYLPETVGSALLCIYDLQGKQLRQIVLNERGQAALSLSASEFRPGIYLYGLIADGQEVDVKRMILTE